MPYFPTETTRGFVAYDENTAETAAVFIADNWTHNAVFGHHVILKTMVLRHGWLEEIADYVFNTAGRLKMFVGIRSDNEASLSMCRKIGFVQVACLTQAYADDVDYIIMEWTRETCPFVKKPN